MVDVDPEAIAKANKQINDLNTAIQKKMKEGREILKFSMTSTAMGKFQEALELLEKMHKIVKVSHSTQSEKFEKVCIDIVNVCNLLAVNLLKVEKYEQAEALLHKSKEMAANNEKGLAMTFNNLAIYYRKKGHLRNALISLESALDIESKHEDTEAKAETHLNTCAVLSELSYHDLALQHAYQAVMIVQTKLLIDFLPVRPEVVKQDQKAKEKKPIQDDYELQREFKDRLAVLTIAYNNLGVEQEFLNMYREALQSYRIAQNFAYRYLGADDAITANLNALVRKAERNLKDHEKRESKQKAQDDDRKNKQKSCAGNAKKVGAKLPSKTDKRPKNDIVKNPLNSQNSRLKKLHATAQNFNQNGNGGFRPDLSISNTEGPDEEINLQQFMDQDVNPSNQTPKLDRGDYDHIPTHQIFPQSATNNRGGQRSGKRLERNKSQKIQLAASKDYRKSLTHLGPIMPQSSYSAQRLAAAYQMEVPSPRRRKISHYAVSKMKSGEFQAGGAQGYNQTMENGMIMATSDPQGAQYTY